MPDRDVFERLWVFKGLVFFSPPRGGLGNSSGTSETHIPSAGGERVRATYICTVKNIDGIRSDGMSYLHGWATGLLDEGGGES